MGGPGLLSLDDDDGWMSEADSVNGWGNLIFSGRGLPQVTESTESETADKRGLLYLHRFLVSTSNNMT